jgi:hypothetical protein
MAWKYFYISTGDITYYSEEIGFETEAEDENIIVDQYYDPRQYIVDPVTKTMVPRVPPLPPFNPRR